MISTDDRRESRDYDTLLFERLKKLRREIAVQEKMPAYCIFRDRTLKEICRYLPGSLSELEKIYGIGPHKLIHYGELFLGEISRHIKARLMERLPEMISAVFLKDRERGGKKQMRNPQPTA